MLRHYLPWLAARYNCSTRRRSYGWGEREQRVTPLQTLAVIKRQNALDSLAYTYANELLSAQVRAVGWSKEGRHKRHNSGVTTLAHAAAARPSAPYRRP